MSSVVQEESRSISENVARSQWNRMVDGKVSIPFRHTLGFRAAPTEKPRRTRNRFTVRNRGHNPIPYQDLGCDAVLTVGNQRPHRCALPAVPCHHTSATGQLVENTTGDSRSDISRRPSDIRDSTWFRDTMQSGKNHKQKLSCLQYSFCMFT